MDVEIIKDVRAKWSTGHTHGQILAAIPSLNRPQEYAITVVGAEMDPETIAPLLDRIHASMKSNEVRAILFP